jgi:RecA/RadA recombinase
LCKLKPEVVDLDRLSLPDRPSFTVKPSQLSAVLSPVLLPKQMSVVHSSNRTALVTLAHTLVVCAAESGFASVYLDSGNNYSPQLVRVLSLSGTDPDSTISRISVAKVLSLSDFDDIVEDLRGVGFLSFVAIDSFTAMLNLSMSPGSAGRQRTLCRVLEQLRRLVNERAAHVMMTDCSSKQWMTGETVPIGGNVLSHSVDALVRIDTLDLPRMTVRVEVERSDSSDTEGGVLLHITRNGFEVL